MYVLYEYLHTNLKRHLRSYRTKYIQYDFICSWYKYKTHLHQISEELQLDLRQVLIF